MELAHPNAQHLPPMCLEGADIGANREVAEHAHDGHLGIDRERRPLEQIGGCQLARRKDGGCFEGRLGVRDRAPPATPPEQRRGQRQRGSNASAPNLCSPLNVVCYHVRVSRGSSLTLTGGLAVNSAGPRAAPAPDRFDRRP